MARYTALLLLAAAATTVTSAGASEIYRFVDANGNVHYVDRPTGEPSEQRLDIVSSRTNNAAVQASVQARLDHQSEREQARARANEEAQAAADAAAAAEQRAQQCTAYRERMETYLRSNRLYREDESGERVYLDEQQMLDARARLQEKIQESCD